MQMTFNSFKNMQEVPAGNVSPVPICKFTVKKQHEVELHLSLIQWEYLHSNYRDLGTDQ